MDLHDICKSLAVEPTAAAELAAMLPAAVPEQWRDLAAALIGDRQQNRMASEGARLRDRAGRVLGICGGQGAGKSSLAAGVVAAAERMGQRAVSLSLDDFYLTRAQRTDLARRVHPLLVTRGVPGTHDVALCIRTIEELLLPGDHQIPRFDKGQDDRQSRDKWDAVAGPFDLVVLEGWCVGAPPQPLGALSAPCNELESSTDPQGVWRGYVNDCLRSDYQALWRLVDELIFLAVPGMDAVLRWRGQQELERPAELRMASAQIAEFVAHYERLTRWMLAEMPAIAHLTGVLDDSHNLIELTQRR
jgi:D-glycerate 3-kinase